MSSQMFLMKIKLRDDNEVKVLMWSNGFNQRPININMVLLNEFEEFPDDRHKYWISYI